MSLNDRENNKNEEKIDVNTIETAETISITDTENEKPPIITQIDHMRKLVSQQKIIEEQESQIKNLENKVSWQHEQILLLQKLLKNQDEVETKRTIELEDKLAIIRQENNNLEKDKKQLMEKLNKTKLIIDTKQQEINNKIEKIENLRKELLIIAKKQDKSNKSKDKGTTTLTRTYKDKRIQTSDKKAHEEMRDAEAQTEVCAATASELPERLNNTQTTSYTYNGEINSQVSNLTESNIFGVNNPAILIKCKNSFEVTTISETIKEIVNNQQKMMETHIRLAKNKRTIIIKVSSEENLKTLHQNLKNNEKLLEQAEIN